MLGSLTGGVHDDGDDGVSSDDAGARSISRL
jgi:hypothetical protein